MGSEPRRPTAIRGARLFDGTGARLLRRPTVIVDGTTIVSVESGGEPPAGTTVVDLGDVTLLPGLVDTHVHLCFDASEDVVGSLAARDDQAVVASILEAGRASLRAGVTTVRDLGDRNYLTLAVGERPGQPTVVVAGPPITTPGGHCHYLGGAAEPTERGVRAAVREHVERGVDVVKIMASGGALTPGTKQERSQFEPDILRAAVDEAHLHGLPVTAHAHGTSSIADALAARVDGMEHVTFWAADGVDQPDELLRRIAELQIVVGVTAGVAPLAGSPRQPEVAARLPRIVENQRRLWELGAPIVAGTDAGIWPAKPHGVLAYAPTRLTDIGMSTVEVLRTITSVAARVCGLEHRKGRIAPGYDADLLAVEGNPLADLGALRRVRAVFVRGTAVLL